MSENRNNIEQDFEQRLETMKANPCKITPEVLETFWEPAREANAALNEAMTAYENDLTTRRAALDKQAKELDAKMKYLKGRINALESQSREAASRGDLDAAADLDEKAESLRKQLSTATRKRRIATSTDLKGDADLFKAISAAKRTYEEAAEAGREYIQEALAVVAEWAKFFEQLQDKTKFAGRYGPNMDSRRYEKIDHHFNAEFYSKIAEKAKAEEQERKAAWEAEKARRSSMGDFYVM